MLIFAAIFFPFLCFSAFYQKIENGDFDQCLKYAALKHWSKYTTTFDQICKNFLNLNFLKSELKSDFSPNLSIYEEAFCFTPGTPVFTHYTSARQRYASHDVGMTNKSKI